jgi:FKBP-type peptidyl-prolyl cis-trans isomerase 2
MVSLPKENVPEEMEIEVGMHIHLRDQAGRSIPAVVNEIQDDLVKLDANHPLAGKTLEFDIEVLKIK